MCGNCSTCFGWYLHPSSGAHTTVSTASGVCHTVTATMPCALVEKLELLCTCTSSTRAAAVAVAVTVWQMPDAVDTVVCGPDDGWRYHPKYVGQFPDINKQCKVASCYIYIGKYLYIRCRKPFSHELTLFATFSTSFVYLCLTLFFCLWFSRHSSVFIQRC